jgi:predicted nucleic acid-binding protein
MKLAYVDSLPTYQKIINDCLNQLIKEGWLLCASEAVLLEVLPKPYRDKNDRVFNIYDKLFKQTKMLKSLPNVFEIALMIAQGENLKAMDAIHVAIALQHGCKRFVSTDPHFKKLKIMPSTWIDLSERA